MGTYRIVQDRRTPAGGKTSRLLGRNGYGLWGPGAYVEQFVWYDDAMRQDDYVIGGCIYAISPTAGWESYDIRGPAAMVLGQYLSVHAPA